MQISFWKTLRNIYSAVSLAGKAHKICFIKWDTTIKRLEGSGFEHQPIFSANWHRGWRGWMPGDSETKHKSVEWKDFMLIPCQFGRSLIVLNFCGFCVTFVKRKTTVNETRILEENLSYLRTRHGISELDSPIPSNGPQWRNIFFKRELTLAHFNSYRCYHAQIIH